MLLISKWEEIVLSTSLGLLWGLIYLCEKIQRKSLTQDLALSSLMAERGRWAFPAAPRRMGRRRRIISCSVKPQKVCGDRAVAWLSWEVLTFLGLLGEVLPCYLLYNTDSGWLLLPLGPTPAFLSVEVLTCIFPFWYPGPFLSAPSPQPSHISVFFCRAAGTWDSKINESHSRFLPARKDREFLTIRASILIVL